MRMAGIALALQLAACASGAQAANCHRAAAEPARQRAAVEAALAPLEARHAADLARLDAASGEAADRLLDAITDADRAARRAALQPLADQGNAEAMVRLAADLRDSNVPQDIQRWFGLVHCAAEAGQANAQDELVRFYWHQRGDGSIAETQRNRAIALDYAERAADGGDLGSLERIATYISGNVHQYPGDLALARRLMELCARADLPVCQEKLAGGSAYDYAVDPVASWLWLARLAQRSPARFAARRDGAWTALPAEQRVRALAAQAAWRPLPWSALKLQWRRIRADILRRGASSLGVDTVCSTQTPWCRGRWVEPDLQPLPF